MTLFSFENSELENNERNSFYEELLTRDSSVSMHHKKIQALATEMCKIKIDSPQKFLLKFCL